MLSAESIKGDFPILQREFPFPGARTTELTYLDNAATSQKPDCVIQRVNHYYEAQNGNVHRAIHHLGETATACVEASRKRVRAFVGAAQETEIIFTHGCTEAINLVARAWGLKHIDASSTILLTEMEHHSNLVPWQQLAQRTGCRLEYIPVTPDGRLDLEQIQWKPSIKLVAVTHMSNVLGTINDLPHIIARAHANKTVVLVDGAQGAAHMPVQVQNLDCDFYTFSGHKMCGPTGVGVLYGKAHLLEAMDPFLGGGNMIRKVGLDRSTWNDLPYKFEAGTPNIAGIIGLGEAIDYLQRVGLDRIQAHENELTRYALGMLEGFKGIQLYGPRNSRGGIISFNLDGVHPHDVAQLADREGVAIRAGHHCAQPLMNKLAVPATARASFYLYNTRADIDRLYDALIKAKEFFS
jgi:cysteine desulfurase/selenocysteine lyase